MWLTWCDTYILKIDVFDLGFLGGLWASLNQKKVITSYLNLTLFLCVIHVLYFHDCLPGLRELGIIKRKCNWRGGRGKRSEMLEARSVFLEPVCAVA